MATYDFSLVDGGLVAFAEYISTEAQCFTGCGTVGLHLLQQYLNQNPDIGSYPPYTVKGVTSTRLAEPGTQPPVYPVEEALAEFSVFVSEAAAAFTGYPLVGQHLLAKYYNPTSVYPEIGNSMSTAVDAPSRFDNGSGLAPVPSRDDAGSENSGLALHSAMDTSKQGMSIPAINVDLTPEQIISITAVAVNPAPVFSTQDLPGFNWMQQQNIIPHAPRQPSHRGASRQHFHRLTTGQIWKEGDTLHVPVMSYQHSGLKVPSFFKNVPDATMSFIGRTADSPDTSDWLLQASVINLQPCVIKINKLRDIIEEFAAKGLEGPALNKWSNSVWVERSAVNLGTVTKFKEDNLL